MGVVLPFPCDHAYIGQTGRCVNIRLSEQKRSLETSICPHVARYCSEHGCVPVFENTTSLSVHGNQLTREVADALDTMKKALLCVSVPSIVLLHDSELSFLNESTN